MAAMAPAHLGGRQLPRKGTVRSASRCAASKNAANSGGISRREAFQYALGVPLATSFVPTEWGSVGASEDEWKSVEDPILAYGFDYPLRTLDGRDLNFVMTRKPERYSSAAPLSPDARERITCELVDFKVRPTFPLIKKKKKKKSSILSHAFTPLCPTGSQGPITAAVSVGPVPPDLKKLQREEWTPERVTRSVLADRSPGRQPGVGRLPVSEIERVEPIESEGVTYLIYEHIAQGSPTLVDKSSETYKHSWASTAERDGYFYTLNLTAPEIYWEEVGYLLKRSAMSFRLLQPGRDFVPPYAQPWRFW